MDEPLRDESRAQPASFNSVPTHVLLHILRYNTTKDWRVLRQVNRKLRKLLPVALLEERFHEEFHQLENDAQRQFQNASERPKIGVADIVGVLLNSGKLRIHRQIRETLQGEQETIEVQLEDKILGYYISKDDRAAVWIMLFVDGHGKYPFLNINYYGPIEMAISHGRSAIVDIFFNMVKLKANELNELLKRTYYDYARCLPLQTRLEILKLLLEAGAEANSLLECINTKSKYLTKEILELLLFNGLRVDRYIGSLCDQYNIDLSRSKIYRKNLLCTRFAKEFEQLEASLEQHVTSGAKKSEIDIENFVNLLLATNRLRINIKRVKTTEGECERAEVLLDDKKLEYFIQQHDIGAVYLMLFKYAQCSSRQSPLRRFLDDLDGKEESAIPRPDYVAWLTAAVNESSCFMIALFCQMTSPTREELNKTLRDALSSPFGQMTSPTRKEFNRQITAELSSSSIVELLLSNGASANCLLDIINIVPSHCFSRKILILLYCHGLNCDSFDIKQLFSIFNLDLVKLRDCENKFRLACNIFADYDGIQRMKEPHLFLTAEAEALKQKAHALLLEAYNISPEILDILCQLKKGLSAINSFHDAIEVIKEPIVCQSLEYKMAPRAQR